MTSELRVLFVCTGNVCRSPAAERLLDGQCAGVRASSAGTHAVVGEPMTQSMAQLLGATADGFRSHQLTAELIADADLVLTMTREHRVEVVRLHPSALRYVFTLREFVRLGRTVLPTVPPAALPSEPAASRLAALIPAALAARAADPGNTEDDDVDDPYCQGEEEYRRSFAQIRSAIQGIVELVG